MPVDSRRLLFEQASAGFVASASARGCCQFVLTGAEHDNFYLEIGPTLTFGIGDHPAPATVIALDPRVMAHIVAKPDQVDFRRPGLMSRVKITGDLELAALLSRLVKRPTAGAKARLAEAEEKARRAPRIPGIARVEAPSDATVREHLEAGTPFVATGSLGSWSVESWTLDSLTAKFGRFRLRALSADRAETVADFVSTISLGRTDVYSAGCALPPAMWAHFKPPFFQGADRFVNPQLWMGRASRRAVTPLHRDPSHGFLGQVLGRKKLLLFSPDQSELLYPYETYNSYQPCWVDPIEPDYQTYPLFRGAQAVEVTLLPGEMLINPAGWYHCVVALDPVMSVSYFLK